MKKFSLFLVVLTGLLLGGCIGAWNRSGSDKAPKAVASAPVDANGILACLAEHQKISRNEYKAAYKAVVAEAAKGTDVALMRLICLSLHDYASHKQFKMGMTLLAKYLKNHPEASAGLVGLHVLMQRLDKEMAGKRNQNSKSLEGKEGLEAEYKELQERNGVLEKGAAEHQEKIRELQTQIEELKNIENIIKNRER